MAKAGKKAADREARGGRPPKWTDPIALQAKIDDYFDQCKGRYLKNDDGTYLLNKYGQPVLVDNKPPTITGLALHIGFNNRTSLLDYADKPEFTDVITRAKTRVEEYSETRLYDKDGVTGAKFALASNCKRWTDRQTVEVDQPKPIEVNIRVV